MHLDKLKDDYADKGLKPLTGKKYADTRAGKTAATMIQELESR